LQNGKVLVAGGFGNETGALQTAERYDPGDISSGNPIDDAQFFVTQHYRDFLSAEHDPAGLTFWTNEIASCGLAWESKFSILYFQHLQNRFEKMCVHALPDLRVAAEHLRDVFRAEFKQAKSAAAKPQATAHSYRRNLSGTLSTIESFVLIAIR
jgi:hypothetical protein